MEFIRDPASLEAVYGPADDWSGGRSDHARTATVDDAHLTFMAAATMVVVATIGNGGVTCSPRGGAAGTLALLDDARTLWVPDAAGGRIHQTVRNLMQDPRVGLLFLAPGRHETLRVEGLARVSADPRALARFPDLDPPVRSVLVVDVQEVRLSGTGPAERAGLWRPPVPATAAAEA